MGLYENLGVDFLLDDDGDLQISPAGDLAITQSGRTCLLQDVNNLLDTLPGDLFSHPAFGAGVPRLFGEEDSPDFERLVVRAITDALTYDQGVGPRLEPESIVVYALPRTGREADFQVSFVPLDEEWTNSMNFVWQLGWPENEQA